MKLHTIIPQLLTGFFPVVFKQPGPLCPGSSNILKAVALHEELYLPSTLFSPIIKEKIIHMHFRRQTAGQQVIAKWVSWLPVGGLEPATSGLEICMVDHVNTAGYLRRSSSWYADPQILYNTSLCPDYGLNILLLGFQYSKKWPLINSNWEPKPLSYLLLFCLKGWEKLFIWIPDHPKQDDIEKLPSQWFLPSSNKKSRGISKTMCLILLITTILFDKSTCVLGSHIWWGSCRAKGVRRRESLNSLNIAKMKKETYVWTTGVGFHQSVLVTERDLKTFPTKISLCVFV